MAHWYSDYLLHEGPFDFSSEQFIQRGIDMIGEACRRRLFFSQPINNWICRQLLGLRALAFRLKARINMKRLNEEESRGVFV
jgi:hypothetical protein